MSSETLLKSDKKHVVIVGAGAAGMVFPDLTLLPDLSDVTKIFSSHVPPL